AEGADVLSVSMDTDTYADFPVMLDKLRPLVAAEQPLLLYCTGGVRCVKVGAYLRSNGLKNIFILRGGINEYVQFLMGSPEDVQSCFVGKNFCFDNRANRQLPQEEQDY